MKYYLRTTRTEGSANLYCNPKINGRAEWLNTMLAVDIEKWLATYDTDGAQSQVKAHNLLKRCGHYSKLTDIESRLADLRRAKKLTKETAKAAIAEVVLADARSVAERMERSIAQRELRAQRSVNGFILHFLGTPDERSSKKGKQYTSGTMRCLRAFEGVWAQFVKESSVKRSLTFDEVDEKLVNKFRHFLSETYMASTCNNKLKWLRLIMKEARKEGLRTLDIPEGLFSMSEVKEQQKAAEVFLTAEELDAVARVELKGASLNKARDIFLLLCLTAQRYSDVTRLRADSIGTSSRGNRVITFYQQKTGKKVVLPIIDKRLEEVLRRNGGSCPKMAARSFYDQVKEVCRLAGGICPSLNEVVPTLLKTRENGKEYAKNESGLALKPKWQLVSSHTGRRTCITLMVLSGRYTLEQMRSVSGHSTESAFLTYIKASSEDMADALAEKNKGYDTLF